MVTRVGRLISFRKKREEKKKLGLCVLMGCNRKAIPNITICKEHRKHQIKYGTRYRKLKR